MVPADHPRVVSSAVAVSLVAGATSVDVEVQSGDHPQDRTRGEEAEGDHHPALQVQVRPVSVAVVGSGEAVEPHGEDPRDEGSSLHHHSSHQVRVLLQSSSHRAGEDEEAVEDLQREEVWERREGVGEASKAHPTHHHHQTRLSAGGEVTSEGAVELRHPQIVRLRRSMPAASGAGEAAPTVAQHRRDAAAHSLHSQAVRRVRRENSHPASHRHSEAGETSAGDGQERAHQA